jgi:pyruvate formate lyase activating enzyme
MNEKGLIFDIQGFSVHDGPGTRTLVFFSGCPLRCEWCSNPEGMKYRQNLMFAKGRCKSTQNNCKRCVANCPYGAITLDTETGLPIIQRAHCLDCDSYECVKACNYEALRLSGKYYTVSELMEVLCRDRNFWGSDGGVTFGGGDPLLQGQFLLDVLKKCKEVMIHTAVETSACINTEIFLETMHYIDFAFVDIKHINSNSHESKTGVGNEKILNNLRTLAKSRWTGRLMLRTPVIAGFNDSEENALETIRFMKENGFFEINLLPFHRLATSKWEQLGKEYAYKDREAMPKEELYSLQNIYLDAGIACYVDTDVIYNLKKG